ncbi:LOW QUALITY PROTEIN: hypothetical protein PanWU01x14_330420, partial [Parasponia andersonii]
AQSWVLRIQTGVTPNCLLRITSPGGYFHENLGASPYVANQ